MPAVTLVHPDGHEEVLDVPVGTSIMQAAVSQGVAGIVGECGGSAMCATCHVYVEADWLGQMPELLSTEDEMLECTVSERLAESRLSCQIKMSDALAGLRLRLPEAQQ